MFADRTGFKKDEDISLKFSQIAFYSLWKERKRCVENACYQRSLYFEQYHQKLPSSAALNKGHRLVNG